MIPQTIGKEYLSSKEAAACLGVAAGYIHKLFSEGKLTGWRGQGRNGRLHISSDSIDRFTGQNREGRPRDER